MNKEIKGVMPALVTPLNADGVTLTQVAEALSGLDLAGDEYKEEFKALINAIK